MNPKEFFFRFFRHTCHALIWLVGFLIIGEWLVPGSVLTHLNLHWLILLAIVTIILYHFFMPPKR